MGVPAGMWSLTANEDESTTAHFFLGAGDEGLGTCGIGMRTEESDSELTYISKKITIWTLLMETNIGN